MVWCWPGYLYVPIHTISQLVLYDIVRYAEWWIQGFKEYILQTTVQQFHEGTTLLKGMTQGILFSLNQCFIGLLGYHLVGKVHLEVPPQTEQNQLQRQN